jgi:hypothetical protein
MIQCPHRSNAESTMAVCYAAKNEVHIKLCEACRSCGDPDPENPNRHLASAILGGFLFKKHNNVCAAEKARFVILKSQIEDKGLDFEQWLGNRKIAPLKPNEQKTTTCFHLGREIARVGCGCWRKSTLECKAKNGLHIIPENDCPCEHFEEV